MLLIAKAIIVSVFTQIVKVLIHIMVVTIVYRWAWDKCWVEVTKEGAYTLFGYLIEQEKVVLYYYIYWKFWFFRSPSLRVSGTMLLFGLLIFPFEGVVVLPAWMVECSVRYSVPLKYILLWISPISHNRNTRFILYWNPDVRVSSTSDIDPAYRGET